MSACICASPESAASYLVGRATSRTVIVHAAACDMAPVVAASALQFQKEGEVLVVCADEATRARLRAAASDAACRNVRIETIEAVALRILSDERVACKTGRDARVVDDNEYDVLLEDMKVSGLKPRRLREMLRFFLKSMSEYADECDGWLISAEEQAVFALLKANLAARRAVLSCELAALAYRGMREAGINPKPLTVVAVDYGAMSKAAQRLVRHLATEGLSVFGAMQGAARLGEPYPHYEGMGELLSEEGITAIRVDAAAPPASERVDSYRHPADEFEGVALQVARLVEGGMTPGDIAVAVPNGIWAGRIAEALRVRGVPCVCAGGCGKAKGDPRDAKRCGELKLRAFAKLRENPRDIVALRSWVGLGDYLMRSDAFAGLMGYARDAGRSAAEVLLEVRAGEKSLVASSFALRMAPAFSELDELTEALEGATASEAVQVFSRFGMPLGERRAALLGQGGAPADVDALARDVLSCGEEEGAGVRIAPFAACCGMHAKVTFAAGLVNGFLPKVDALDEGGYAKDHRERAMERDRRLYEDVRATASEAFVCSHFERDILENADALRMRISRVLMSDGRRYAALSPSEFIAGKNLV